MSNAPARPAEPHARGAGLVQRFTRGMRHVSRLCGVIAAGLITAAVVIVCQMVTVRYVLGESTIWQTDFVTYCLIAATFLGSPYVLLTRGHVNVDVVPHWLAPRGRYRLALLAGGITTAFALVLTVLTTLFWKEAWDNRWVSDTMWRARLWIPYGSMPIGLALLTLQSIAGLANLVTGREPPFGIRDGDKAVP
jgi:TRAP-type C4-dicarboxylate transport system permease small subunit